MSNLSDDKNFLVPQPPSSTKVVTFFENLKKKIEDFEQGNTSDYELFITELSNSSVKSSRIIQWFKEAHDISHKLNKTHSKLVDALLKVRWMEREETVIQQFQTFIITLVASNPIHLYKVLMSLVKCLTPIDSHSDKKLEVYTSNSRVYEAVHSIFKQVLVILPTCSDVLMKCLINSFPFIRKPSEILVDFVKNILHIISYNKELRTGIFNLLVQKMTNMDVYSPRDVIENAEEEFELEQDQEEDDDEKEESDEMHHKLANTLDLLMVEVMSFIHSNCFFDDKLEFGKANDLFDQLLEVFSRRILPIHGVAHVQFIIFYIASFHKSFHLKLLKFFWNKSIDMRNPTYIRQTSISYIASFIARSKYVPISTVAMYLRQLSKWCHQYIQTSLFAKLKLFECNVIKHINFYSTCQAIFYIIVFRHEEILSRPSGLIFLKDLNLYELLTSNLNPLKACLPAVVSMFSKYMRLHKILYCETIIQQNNRQLIPVVGMKSSIGSQNPLESFFPFDPYILKKSVNCIEPLYLEWKGPQMFNYSVEEEDEEADMDVELTEVVDTAEMETSNQLEDILMT